MNGTRTATVQDIISKLAFPKELLLIDSITITVGKTRLPWAPYHGERAAIKLHVALRADLTFVRFARLLLMNQLPVEWSIRIHRLISLDSSSTSITYSG